MVWRRTPSGELAFNRCPPNATGKGKEQHVWPLDSSSVTTSYFLNKTICISLQCLVLFVADVKLLTMHPWNGWLEYIFICISWCLMDQLDWHKSGLISICSVLQPLVFKAGAGANRGDARECLGGLCKLDSKMMENAKNRSIKKNWISFIMYIII